MTPKRYRVTCPDLDAREEPRDVGSRLDVGGFVLADPFETLLRLLSASYLSDAWTLLSAALHHYDLAAGDLSWGHLHPGVTSIDGLSGSAPTDFVGWTSRELKDFDHDDRFPALDRALRAGRPALACAVAWRSLKWAIAPDDVALGLRLVMGLGLDDPADWNPEWLLEPASDAVGAWADIARAIAARDQRALDRGMSEARATYSALGYDLVQRGFTSYLEQMQLNLVIGASPEHDEDSAADTARE